MTRTFLSLLTSAIAVSAGTFVLGSSQPASNGQVHRSALHDYRVVTVVDALVQPWSIAFLPGGDMLITERPGRLRIVRNGKLLPQPVEGVPTVLSLDAGRAARSHAASRTSPRTGCSISPTRSRAPTEQQATTALVRGRFENDRLTDVEQLFESVSQGRGHFGGKIAFDKNGYPVPDARRSPGAARGQPRGASGAGSVEPPRQDRSGCTTMAACRRTIRSSIAPGREPEIWSYGHRNVQGSRSIPRPATSGRTSTARRAATS